MRISPVPDHTYEHKSHNTAHNKTTSIIDKHKNSNNININIEQPLSNTIKPNGRKRNLSNALESTNYSFNSIHTYNPTYYPLPKRQKLSFVESTHSKPTYPMNNNHWNTYAFINNNTQKISNVSELSNRNLHISPSKRIENKAIPQFKYNNGINKSKSFSIKPLNIKYNYYIKFGQNKYNSQRINNLKTLSDFSNLVKEQINKFNNKNIENQINIQPIQQCKNAYLKLLNNKKQQKSMNKSFKCNGNINNNNKQIQPILAGTILNKSTILNGRQHTNINYCSIT